MAKYTQQAIMYSLLKLLQEKPIDKITVKDICELCEINRNTFYYYYRDIYQVLEELLRIETEKSLKEKQEYKNFYEEYLQKYHLVLEYKKAVFHLYNSKNRDMILKYFYDVTEDFVEKYVRKPYEYFDRDLIINTDFETAIDLANGDIEMSDAYAEEKITVWGNLDKAIEIYETIFEKDRR